MRLLLLTGLIVLLSSCTYFRQYDLPFPESVSLQGRWLSLLENHEEMFCYPHDDALVLSKWLDKVEAFKHAYERQR